MSSKTKKSQTEMEEEDRIKNYLQTHPDFFSLQPDLLETINLPHNSGQAVSLVERQVSVLRDRNVELRHRLNNLLESAQENDKLFEKTKRLVLSLIEANSLQQIAETLYISLGTDYQIEHYSLLILSANQQLKISPARVIDQQQANAKIGTLLRTNRAICGVLRPEELRFLFTEKSDQIGSVAAVPLTQGSAFGILAVGNTDPNYYKSSMSTLFLSYIAEVLNRVIPRFLSMR